MTVATEQSQRRALPAAERVELILSHLDRLPTLSSVAARLLAVTASDDSCAQDVIDIVRTDPSLAAGILRMVGRADVGARSDVTITIDRAVKLLGFRAVRNAVLSRQFFEIFPSSDSSETTVETRRGMWRHSLAVACVAESIGERLCDKVDVGETFLCGLLHDIGKIALDACLPKSYARVVERGERNRTCICDVERAVFALDHTVAGKRLVSRWGMSRGIVESVWLHHQSPDALPLSVAHPEAVKIVHLADNLVRRAGIGYSGYRHVADVSALAVDLGLKEGFLDKIIDELPSRLEPLLELMGLDDTAPVPVIDVSAEDEDRRLRRVNERLAESNRVLTVRAACLDVVDQFTRKLTEHDRVGDVCVAAAEAVQAVLPARGVCVFVGGSTDGCLHVGWTASREGESSVAVLDDAECKGQTVGARALAASCGGLVQAPAGCDDIWRGCLARGPEQPLWMIPIGSASIGGGILLASREGEVRGYRTAANDVAAMSRAISLAVASAWARSEADRMAEELVELNRRWREAQVDLLRVRSMSMISEMAAGAAHELNNPLAVISGRVQMELAVANNPERRRALEIVLEHTEKASEIVLDLMSFAKPDAPAPIVQSLVGVFEALYQHWQAQRSVDGPHLTVSAGDPDMTVFADGVQVLEILNEAVSNGVAAADSAGGLVRVNSSSRLSDETVRITIEDNGVGMTPDVVEHAFDPFFSNRPAGRRRGLGLSRAYRLAEINGGRLWLESKPNVGTTVHLELPAHGPRE